MAYFAPFVDAAGLHLPTYADILAYRLSQERTIYGPTIYLGTDSADYQRIAATMLIVNDTMQALQLVYNSRSPATAVGAALDGVIKNNGLARKRPSYSTCPVVLTGTPGALVLITNGYVGDVQGNSWALPTPLYIPTSGTVTVTATCQTAGPISVLAGQIATITQGLTAGWLAVTNTVASTPGQPVETDSQVRGRQAISVALPSRTVLAGTIARIAAVAGVTRSNVHENFTGAVDSFGTPPHSVSAVVEGGSAADVAAAIAINRGIGPYTNGSTAVNYTDPATGQVETINFSTPTYVPIAVALSVHGLSGYTSATSGLIVAALVSYLNGLQIGENLTISALYFAVGAVMSNISLPQFSVQSLTAGVAGGSLGTSDIAIAYNQVAQGVAGNITLTAV